MAAEIIHWSQSIMEAKEAFEYFRGILNAVKNGQLTGVSAFHWEEGKPITAVIGVKEAPKSISIPFIIKPEVEDNG